MLPIAASVMSDRRVLEAEPQRDRPQALAPLRGVADGVADHFGGVAIEAAAHLALDEAFQLGREVDVHGHLAISNG